MAVTGATVRSALAAIGAVGNQIRDLDTLAAGADAALRQAPPGLTAAGAASFLATMAQESAYFRTTVEYGSGQRYAPFIGRTFEQITWEANYRAFGRWCADRGIVRDGEVFVRDPVSLGAYAYAWLGGVWYFGYAGLWPHANRGDHYAVSQGVNRGAGAIGTSKVPNHWTERRAMYDAFLRAGDALLPTATPGGDWFDMATEDDLRRVLREEAPAAIWHHPIPDWYTPENDALPAFAAMGWATTHAAHARDAARQGTAVATRAEASSLAGRKELAELGREVSELVTQGLPSVEPGAPAPDLDLLTGVIARLNELDTRLRALEHAQENP